MNKFLLIFVFAVFSTGISAQVKSSVIFRSSYAAFGVTPRIENDGIFGISSFDVRQNEIAITLNDQRRVLIFSDGRLNRIIAPENYSEYLINAEPDISGPDGFTENSRIKTIFIGGAKKAVADNGGVIKTAAGSIYLNYINRSGLSLKYNLSGLTRSFNIRFPNDLACTDFIGIDQNSNTFLLVEKYVSEIPLSVERYIYCINGSGETRSVLKIPHIKYFSLPTEFRIDTEVNLYHLLTEKENLSVIKWSGLTNFNSGIIQYPEEYNYSLHYDNFVTARESSTPQNPKGIEAAASRVTAIRLGETYAYHRYNIVPANLAVANTTAPDGDVVRTPPWLVTGRNARVPYKWGGFNTLAQINDGLAANKYAGDINTDGVSSYAVGVDCSGFVSRCWQMTYHASTSYMPNITTQYTSWDSLKPGDAIHKVGHVRLYLERNPNGSFKVVESAGRNWDVSYWSFLASDLTAYAPRYYNSMQNDYINGRPQITSALLMPLNQIKLTWVSDTSNIAGYRLYRSFDGTNYTLVMNESVLKSDNVVIPQETSQAFYRVAKVLNNPPTYTESNWSNTYSAFNANSQRKYLIIDGFSREIGSWQGPGHNFVVNYAKALKALNCSYEAVKTSYLDQPSINLSDYFGVIWIAGDESLLDESFSTSEQNLIKNYLENGGNFFASGSEIGWDLYGRGSTSDKFFYNNYLKANFISDDAGVTFLRGQDSTSMQGINFYFGQTYEEDFPDEVGEAGGSKICIKYSNGKGAGVQYTGNFGSSSNTGRVIYLAFPLETTANDTSFNMVIRNADIYFNSPFTAVDDKESASTAIQLYQNYPNPFSISTLIKYSVPGSASNPSADGRGVRIVLKVYNTLGKDIATLVNEEKPPGTYEIYFNASVLPSGIYYYRLTAEKYSDVKKLVVIK